MQETGTKVSGNDLTKQAPRSPHLRLGGFVILARAIDKCRATIADKVGEYEFNCPLDNTLFKFKGIKGSDFKKFVATGASDDLIVEWIKKSGIVKTDAEVLVWSDAAEAENYKSNPSGKKWLEAENVRLGLSKDGTLFDYLDADDKASFSNSCQL